jgi:DNA mismatch repair protein MutL
MLDRRPISPLPDDVIASIAAGEVIERPATIVKELVENSLDAGATRISISLQNGGLDQIIVTDNGAGIPAEELLLATQRHTTSKITKVEDFNRLLSYGFRGEALASIASMSAVTLRSRTIDSEVGVELHIKKNKPSKVVPIGMPIGTQVTVEDIFAGLPARRKFLGTAAQERKAILDVITEVAVTLPEVDFHVTEEQKNLLSLPARQTVLERLEDLFGSEVTEHFWPFHHQSEKVSFVGFLGSPKLARRAQPLQFVSVNRRPVHQPTLSMLVRQSYASSLEPKASPAFVLFVEISPTEIDVNVHPRKEMIKWQDEAFITQTLRETIEDRLQNTNTTYSPTFPQSLTVHDSDPMSQYVHRSLPLLHDALKNEAPTWYHALASREQTILQVQNTYLITETTDGLVVIDQHAAHERVLYQQFLDLFHQQMGEKKVVELSPPVVIKLKPSLSTVLSEHIETLSQIGCDIEPFGEQAFILRTLPELLREHQPQKVIENVLEDIQNGVPLTGVDELAHRTLAYLACRSAVKAGDPLTQDQAKVLLEKLEVTPFAFSCPHGRPTLQKFSWTEVGKWFQRK